MKKRIKLKSSLKSIFENVLSIKNLAQKTLKPAQQIIGTFFSKRQDDVSTDLPSLNIVRSKFGGKVASC